MTKMIKNVLIQLIMIITFNQNHDDKEYNNDSNNNNYKRQKRQ